MVVPNAVDILRDHLPKYASPYDEEVYLQKVADAMPEGTWFDSGSVLREHKNIQLYYRTDHHWTTEAAYYVYAAWAEEKGLSPLALSDYKRRRSQMDSSARLMPRSADATAAIRSMFIFRRKRKNIR